jgi:hypothetical protein
MQIIAAVVAALHHAVILRRIIFPLTVHNIECRGKRIL